MKNKEKFSKEIVEVALNGNSIAFNKASGNFCLCREMIDCKDCKFNTDGKHRCRNARREWAEQEYTEQILTDKEKNYLGAVIKPFRDRVNYIDKKGDSYYYIEIELTSIKDIDFIDLPYFEKDAMYKGMELKKQYTLEELGL